MTDNEDIVVKRFEAEEIEEAEVEEVEAAVSKEVMDLTAGDKLLPGMNTYKPVPGALNGLKSPSQISGSDFHQMLQISLAPGDIMTAEPGTMVMSTGGLTPQVETGGLQQGLTRACCAGGSLFRVIFENKTDKPQFLALAPPQPGRIIPIDLEEWSGVTLSTGVFVGAFGRDWSYQITTPPSIGTALVGGQGLILTILNGKGMAFITASGCIEVVDLKEGEQLIVEQDNLVAYANTVKFDIRMVGSALTCCCAGQGLFNAIMTGPGKVIVESLPIRKLALTIAKYLPKQRSGGGGGGGGDE